MYVTVYLVVAEKKQRSNWPAHFHYPSIQCRMCCNASACFKCVCEAKTRARHPQQLSYLGLMCLIPSDARATSQN